jgi:DNA-binding NarL/FixJ family response regulator
MVPYRIILADNHAPLRRELRRMLDEQSDLEIAGEAGEGLGLLSLLKSTVAGPLLVILSLTLPNLQGSEGIRTIKAIRAETQVLILSMHEDAEYLRQAISTGAEGYLIIGSIDKELLRAVETIRSGKVYVPPIFAGDFCSMHHV